mgnify:CR=1 FL=1
MQSTVGAVEERWTLQTFPPDQRVEGWREVVDQTHLPWSVRATAPTGPSFDALVRRRRIGPLSLVDCVCDPCSGSRRASEISRTDGEYIGALLVLQGSERIGHSSRDASLTAGELVLWDGVRPSEFAVGTRLHKRTLLVPRDLLSWRVPKMERVTAVPLGGPQVELLSAYLAALVEGPTLDQAGAESAALAAIELLAAAVSPVARINDQSLRLGVLARAHHHIEANLADPSLDPGRIAAACRVSVRTLHAAFEHTGESVCAHLRRRRLERCHGVLGRGGGETVYEVALRFGFRNPAHFSRLFRATYGVSPSELADAAHTPEPA